MDKRSTWDYTDIYSTFLRIKAEADVQDFIVFLDGKMKGTKDGKDGKKIYA